MEINCFEDVCKIEDLTIHPWARTDDLQKRYDEVKDKTQVILKTLLKPRELRLNDYPYKLPLDCIHYVLWSKRDMTQAQVDKYLKTHLKNREYVAFTNLNKNKSVDLFHAHVICKSL